MPKFVMLVGLPGSGKSTYANKLTTSIRVTKYLSSDSIREELYGDESIQGDPNKVFRIMHQRAKEYLTQGFDVVYDATNVTRKNRRGIISEIKHLCDEGLEAHIVWAPYQECLNRDKERKRSVGQEVIHKFLHRWQSPYYDEGFTHIELVLNCNVGWNRIVYSNSLLDNMRIPHDNPHHQLDIDQHCATAENYIYNKYGSKYGWELVYAAAYHDIGKPFTKGYKNDPETGKIDYSVAHYYQHDNVGGYLVYGFYDKKKQDEAVKTSWLVCNHMQPYFQSNYYKCMKADDKKLIDLLHEADAASH